MPAPETHSIRVIPYWGDLDNLADILIIGPYPSVEARDQDLHRLENLHGAYGSAEFLPSTLDPSTPGLDGHATPAQVAGCGTLEDLAHLLYRCGAR